MCSSDLLLLLLLLSVTRQFLRTLLLLLSPPPPPPLLLLLRLLLPLLLLLLLTFQVFSLAAQSTSRMHEITWIPAILCGFEANRSDRLRFAAICRPQISRKSNANHCKSHDLQVAGFNAFRHADLQ